ncbi:unnamed protein product [Angiostrongylus costaricensis]|uniref:Flagellar FliJ protein n=1 Tax=Angiostrongylus costaricensis TaxID=334426 RepID=A0A0R3PJX8_ANGCS|nr:unnamed protein product [Angiostrongylus costaricensis]
MKITSFNVRFLRHRFTASQEQLRRLEEYEDQRESIRRAVAKQWDRFYNDYFDKMKTYALQIELRRYNALLRRQTLERASIADTMRQFGLSSAGLLSTISSGEEEEKPKSPFGEVRPEKNAPVREANRSSKALDSVVNS